MFTALVPAVPDEVSSCLRARTNSGFDIFRSANLSMSLWSSAGTPSLTACASPLPSFESELDRFRLDGLVNFALILASLPLVCSFFVYVC